jgi:hypothetical protein
MASAGKCRVHRLNEAEGDNISKESLGPQAATTQL